MLRISKMADYAAMIMGYLAANPTAILTAKEIAAHTMLAEPTVSKLLKLLTNNGLLMSHRGASGGYSIKRAAEKISIAQIISAIEGNIAVTECALNNEICLLETTCASRSAWMKVNVIVKQALEKISLKEFIN